jgi:WD40 repeat protein
MLTRECERVWKEHTFDVTSVIFNTINDEQLASGSNDQSVKIWDISGDRSQRTIAHDSRIQGICFSTDGKQLVSANACTASCSLPDKVFAYFLLFENKTLRSQQKVFIYYSIIHLVLFFICK